MTSYCVGFNFFLVSCNVLCCTTRAAAPYFVGSVYVFSFIHYIKGWNKVGIEGAFHDLPAFSPSSNTHYQPFCGADSVKCSVTSGRAISNRVLQ